MKSENIAERHGKDEIIKCIGGEKYDRPGRLYFPDVSIIMFADKKLKKQEKRMGKDGLELHEYVPGSINVAPEVMHLSMYVLTNPKDYTREYMEHMLQGVLDVYTKIETESSRTYLSLGIFTKKKIPQAALEAWRGFSEEDCEIFLKFIRENWGRRYLAPYVNDVVDFCNTMKIEIN